MNKILTIFIVLFCVTTAFSQKNRLQYKEGEMERYICENWDYVDSCEGPCNIEIYCNYVSGYGKGNRRAVYSAEIYRKSGNIFEIRGSTDGVMGQIIKTNGKYYIKMYSQPIEGTAKFENYIFTLRKTVKEKTDTYNFRLEIEMCRSRIEQYRESYLKRLKELY